MHLVLCCVAALALTAAAAPGAEPEPDDDQRPVKYDGAQLWRIPYDGLQSRNAVADLQNSFDVALWNSNGSSVDMLLKQPSVGGASRLMAAANVSYAVLIDDLQRNIEAENPPAEVIQQLQNRKARSTRATRKARGGTGDDTATTSPAHSWPQFMHHPMSRSEMARMRGALMGYNSLEAPMALWPEARWGHRMTWSAYHRTEDIHGYVDYLAKTYPELCSVQSIGNSKEGRPLKLLRISNGNPSNPAIWIDGGIHAREWISPASVTYIVNQFAEEWDAQPEYVRNIDWYVLPMANPDGYEYTHTNDRLWRKNRGGVGRGRCAGADLNRNFGYRWGGQGASQQPCSEIFAGRTAFSEPETLAQKRFMAKTAANFRGFLTFHSYGQYILYPWGYDRVVPPDYKDLERVGRDAAKNMRKLDGKNYQVGASGTLLYPAAGASDDWAKSLGIKYSYTVELRDAGRYGFILPASEIERTALEAMEMVFAVARAVDAEK